MRELRKCVICGKEYITSIYNSKYCSEECKMQGIRALNKINDRAKRERRMAERVARENSHKPLIDIAVEAKKAGMSYGQYVARMGL